MDVGFETIGNATLICHDRVPVLATDPWVEGNAYFGSWALSHQIPVEQLEAIRKCEFIWFSHGHPDHLNGDSLPLFQGKKILIPNHYGNRMMRDLTFQGYQPRVLQDRVWTQLSPRIRVMCIADYNQDAILLVDVNGRLVVNQNDAGDRGWGAFVRRIVKQYPVSFLLALAGYGDADMLNYFDEEGQRLPLPARAPLGGTVSQRANVMGTRYFVPFSSLHRYQRSDSVWLSPQAATLADFSNGFHSTRCELLPAFTRWNCLKDEPTAINPLTNAETVRQPEEFGDNWSDGLGDDDRRAVEKYFRSIEMLQSVVDFINVRVGGRDFTISFDSAQRHKKGLTFEAPRASLMTAIQYRIFDDLLIGNFMKVTLHGDWGKGRLYPDFSPVVCKYADNGGVRTEKELSQYFAHYRRKDQLGYIRHVFEADLLQPMQHASGNLLRTRVGTQSPLFRVAKKAYWTLRMSL